MKNSDDAKLIAGAIEKAGRIIADAIKESARYGRYQIAEESIRILSRNFPANTFGASDTDGLIWCAVPTDSKEE